MPGTTVVEPPSVSLSFANNFWGKEDAGVAPLLERMHNAKVTSDELKAFYVARAAIEDEYARKLLSLSRKPLGSSEAGTLRMSLDVVRGEVESMGKAHHSIAGQMKSELEEPLGAFAGGMKERRKIVQTGIEKLLKLKTQQTIAVNKSRDRYEQECLKIKGYLAQGHMVMGQEERKNKAKLEKTQIQLSATSNEYEAAVKVLEETTGRWNRDWKAACDKFQDLEEERLDFMKSSLWSFANISSTVCVSDDASCEKIRLSLEDCDVEKDITNFIRESGTGQEIPDPPKYINFCRGDVNDNASDVSDEGNFSVAQFQRTMNPAFRTSSPQPSTYESHHDPNSALAKQLGHEERAPSVEEPVPMPQQHPQAQRKQSRADNGLPSQNPQLYQASQFGDIPRVPHNEYPMDGMTQFCRIAPPSQASSVASPARPSSRESQSDYSNPTSFSSMEPPSGTHSPIKQMNGMPAPVIEEKNVQKKQSTFFGSHSPFRRRSKHEKESSQPSIVTTPATSPVKGAGKEGNNSSRQPRQFGQEGRNMLLGGDRTVSPEPVDPRASFQLNIGNNVFDVASPDERREPRPENNSNQEELDPIAQALAELKGVTKQSSVRMSADRYHGLATPAPPGTPSTSGTPLGMPAHVTNSAVNAAQRGTPPPSYEQPMSRLGAPQPAFTARAMQQTTQRYIDQKQSMFDSTPRPSPFDKRTSTATPHSDGRSSSRAQNMVRSTSPAPPRSVSPRPGLYNDGQPHMQRPQQQQSRGTPQNSYATTSRSGAQSSTPTKRRTDEYNGYGSRGGSPSTAPPLRAVSPQPSFHSHDRPSSSRGSDMALQLAPGPQQREGQAYGAAPKGRPGGGGRPVSSYYGPTGDAGYARSSSGGSGPLSTRIRSKSVADGRQYTKDGRPILHFSRAMYMYQAAIPEELSFAKGDILAVLRLQDDGWWEAEVVGKPGRPGLVPSNYLQNC